MSISNKLDKLLSSFIIFVFITSLTIQSVSSLSDNAELKDNISFSALTSHAPIFITSDGTGFSSVSGVTGSGSSGDPWIIEGFSIDASGTSYGGIYIASTTDHFIIRNCYVTGGPHSGIYISSVADGTFLIKNNTLENNQEDGIFLTHSADGMITDNVCNNNGMRGIHLDAYVEYNVVTNNTCTTNGGNGISTLGADTHHITVFNNTIEDNGGDGIYLNNDYQSVGNNTCTNNNGTGVLLNSASHSNIENNTVSSNGEYGIHVNSGLDIHLANNVLTSDGFYVTTALPYYDQIYFVDNSVNGLPFGYFVNSASITISSAYGQFILINCFYVTIENQNIANVGNGIYMLSSTGVQVKDSLISNCDYNAIYGLMSNNSQILNNQITDSELGISFFNRNSSWDATYGNHLISSNVISNAYVGISVESALEAVIYNNTITNFEHAGIHVYTVSNNPLDNYVISYNEVDGLGLGIYVVNANWNTKATQNLVIHHNDILSSSNAMDIQGVRYAEIYENYLANFINLGLQITCGGYTFDTEVLVYDNEIDNGKEFGISLYKVSNAIIENNIVENIAGTGIIVDNCVDNITVSLNTITNCTGSAGIFGEANNLLIEKNTISETINSGIMVNCDNVTIHNNTLSVNGNFGVYIANDASNITLLENVIVNIKLHGVYIGNNGDNITIANCTFSQFLDLWSGTGILSFGCGDVDILHNSISGAPTAAIDLDGNGQSTKFENYYVFNNYITYSKVGIILQNGIENATIEENVVRYSSVNGISLLDVSNIEITKNKVVTSGTYGIAVDGTDQVNIIYNLVQDSGSYGIVIFDDSSYVIVHHNTLYGNNFGGTSQAMDDGTNNIWYDDTVDEGNYWDDWSGTGTYAIDGTASSEDLYPLGEALETPLIHEFNPLLLPALLTIISALYIVLRRRR